MIKKLLNWLKEENREEKEINESIVKLNRITGSVYIITQIAVVVFL